MRLDDSGMVVSDLLLAATGIAQRLDERTRANRCIESAHDEVRRVNSAMRAPNDRPTPNTSARPPKPSGDRLTRFIATLAAKAPPRRRCSFALRATLRRVRRTRSPMSLMRSSTSSSAASAAASKLFFRVAANASASGANRAESSGGIFFCRPTGLMPLQAPEDTQPRRARQEPPSVDPCRSRSQD